MRALTGRANDAELAALEAWEAAAPENARHLHELQRMLASISTWYRGTPVSPPPAVDTLIRRAQLRQAQSERGMTRGRGRRAVQWLAGVAAVLLIGANAVVLHLGTRRIRSTDAALLAAVQFTSGDSRLPIALNDGTRIRLGPHSQLRVDSARGVRRVWLDGRADFLVAADRHRPFVVRTGAGEVRDLDTHFVVRATQREMHVAVFQGTVILARTTGPQADIALAAGELGWLAQDGSPRVLDRRVPHSSDEWLAAALVFEGETVAQVAQEVQAQYHVAVRVLDPVVGRRTVTAWFSREPAGGAHDVLVAVCRAVGARCVITDSLATISSQLQ